MILWLSLFLLLPLFPSRASGFTQGYHMLATEEASTIGEDNLQTEIELGVTKQPDASELYNIPRIRLTYGLSEWADIEFEYEVLAVNNTDFTEADTGKIKENYDSAGTGDLRIRLKVAPYEFGRHRMGVQFATRLPNAVQEQGLGTNETDFKAKVLFSTDWGRLVTHLNGGIAVTQNISRNRDLDNFFIWGIGGEYELADSLTLMGEIEGSTGLGSSVNGFTENIAEGDEGIARARARLALSGPIGDWRWGVSAFKGVNSHTEDWGAQIGLSRTWGIDGLSDSGPAQPIREKDSVPESYYNPLKTEEAYTIGERNVRTEVAFGYADQPDGSDLYLLPDLTLGWGIGPRADLEFGFQYLVVRDTSRFDRHGNVIETDMDEDGIGDIRVKFKTSPFQCRYGRLGFQLMTKVPTAEDKDALGTGELDFSVKVLFSTDWAQFFEDSALGRLKTHLNVGLAIQADPKKLSSQDDYVVAGIAAEYEILPALVFWGELVGSSNTGSDVHNISEGDYGDAFAEARLGLTGSVPEIGSFQDWKWGATLSSGLNNESRDWTASIGLSHTWGL